MLRCSFAVAWCLFELGGGGHEVIAVSEASSGGLEHPVTSWFEQGIETEPAAVVGLLLGDSIKDRLFGPWPVVAAWLVGGVFLVWWHPRPGRLDLTALTVRHATIIGAAQILALWPGMSRSLVTIAAALALGASMSAAVEFSFLLGLATLSAATLYDLAKNGQTLLADYGWRTPLLGGLVAFITAVVAVRWLVSFLHTHPLSIFGWYRIGIAVTVAGLIGIGAI